MTLKHRKIRFKDLEQLDLKNHFSAIEIETGETVEIKKCTNNFCIEPWIELSKFRKNKSSPDGLQYWCNECKAKADRRCKDKRKAVTSINGKKLRALGAEFKKWAHRISFADPTRKGKFDTLIGFALETKCTYCGVWFEPKLSEVMARAQALNGSKGLGIENRLYCSTQCKQDCPAYNYKGGDPNRSFKNELVREVQPELRQMVFKRDNYTCQTCDVHKLELDVPLHCHHDEGIRWEPIESADIDRCSTQCKNCHKEIHSKEGCNYYELKCPEEFRVSP